ncbi:MAG TPA: hypothetical protein VFE62_10290 [Gemmataceae bacterium]|nr:hypothetical protein [Gemmataceae bacterium]
MQQQHGKEESGMRTSFNAVLLLASGWAWCFLPFLRVNLGPSALGIRGVLAIIIMWMFCGFVGCPELILFFLVWIVVVLIQRIRTAIVQARGVEMHSRYSGDPLVWKLLPFMRPSTAKLLEVCLLFAVGLAVGSVIPAFGGFIAIGAVAIAIVESLDDQSIRNRKQAMRDADIEARFYSDLHNGRRDDY